MWGLHRPAQGCEAQANRRSIWRDLVEDRHPGRVAERLNAAVLKTVGGGNVARGFESPPFRFRRVESTVECRWL